jgi:hypothetical protein
LLVASSRFADRTAGPSEFHGSRGFSHAILIARNAAPGEIPVPRSAPAGDFPVSDPVHR